MEKGEVKRVAGGRCLLDEAYGEAQLTPRLLVTGAHQQPYLLSTLNWILVTCSQKYLS